MRVISSFTFILLAFHASNCRAVDFFVAPDGSDSNPGTEALPFKSIQKGCDAAAAGSTVFVKAGVYKERVTLNNSGNAADGFITLQNFNNDAAVIDGTGLTPGDGSSALIWIENKSFIRVKGLELRNYSTSTLNTLVAGIYMRGSGDRLEIRNCHVHDIASTAAIQTGGLGRDAHGIAAYGTDGNTALTHVVYDGCEVDHCTLGSSESMVLNGNVDGFEITNNTVHEHDNIGIVMIGWEKTAKSNDQARNGLVRGNTVFKIHSKGNPAYGSDSSAGGIYVDGGRDIVIERNRVFEADYGFEIGVEHRGKTASGVIVRDNIVYNCLVTGLAFGGYDTKRGVTENCQFLNNTIFHNDTSNSGTGEVLVQQSRNNVFKNNILAATEQNILITNPFAKSRSASNVFDYNLYFAPGGTEGSQFQWNKKTYASFSQFQSSTKQDAHSKFSDPQFNATGTPPDLTLQASSPAIDSGDPSMTPAAGETDFAGDPRLNGSAVDIGAFER